MAGRPDFATKTCWSCVLAAAPALGSNGPDQGFAEEAGTRSPWHRQGWECRERFAELSAREDLLRSEGPPPAN
jgi:hypothetical protein